MISPAGERNQAYGLIAPATLVLAGVAAYPVLASGWLSLHRLILVFREQRFVGLTNYATLLGDARFWSALAHTSSFACIAVSIELAVGLAFALLLDGVGRGKSILRAAVLVPWAMPTVISAKIWAYLLNPESGAFGRLLPGVDWLGTPVDAMAAAILLDVWKTTPFVALLLLAGLQSIPAPVYEAARVDGASAWMTFWRVKIPLVRTSMLIALLFRTLDAFRVFDSIYVLTQGGPANATETLSIYTFKTMMRSGDFGYGSTLAVATFLCIALISVVYLGVFRAGFGERA